ncbi:response regulator [Winogradskyella wichelsiae]|uniref:response regulator n=1 Tax=Winogradskyella wichelsiae TaxID=2697007 RepID=UPI003EF564CF
MNRTYNVLIIDDHPFVIDAFKNTFSYLSSYKSNLDFNIDEAQNCQSAFEKITNLKRKNDLIILDISLPSTEGSKIKSGEDLGIIIKETSPDTKILVCTSHTDCFRLEHILHAFDPIGFVNKQDVNFSDFAIAIENVLSNKTYYSQTIIDVIKNKSLRQIKLDDFDVLILKELSNGSKMKDLVDIIPLSKSGIVKRKRLLKQKLNTRSNSDRNLVLEAKKKGFI